MEIPKVIIDMIHKKKTSIVVHEINQRILKINRSEYFAEDLYCHNMEGDQHFWDNNHNVKIIRFSNLKLNPIHLDYISVRNLGFQWTYICSDCGEFVKMYENREVKFCKCCDYVY